MSLSAALARKQRRETHYDLLIADPTDAEAQVELAQRDLRLAKARHTEDSDEARAAQAQLDEALAAVRECTHRIVFQAMDPDAFEELISQHPPTPEGQKNGDQWEGKTFTPALLAACAVDGDLDAEGWAAELASGRWNTADRNAIFSAALAANLTPRSLTVPFG